MLSDLEIRILLKLIQWCPEKDARILQGIYGNSFERIEKKLWEQLGEIEKARLPWKADFKDSSP